MATGAYPMEFRVTNRYASGSFMTSVFDTLLIVNRFFGEYGAGFGISGVEQLYFNQPVNTGLQHILWEAGTAPPSCIGRCRPAPPGSRRWVRSRTPSPAAGAPNRARAPPSTALELRRHIATTNRTGQTTTFTYTGTPPSSRLTAINIPPTGAYTLAWDGTAENNLDYILDPAGRKLNVDIVSGRVNSFTDPVAAGRCSVGCRPAHRQAGQPGRVGDYQQYVRS